MGTWTFGYDTLNRLTSATAGTNAPAPYTSNYGCWTYDDFGNRKSESMSTTACTANPALMSWASYTTTNTNRMDSTSLNTNQKNYYDAAGNVTNDGLNAYFYDPEGRICAVSETYNGTTFMTGYLYDAEGTRIAKGPITTWGSCDPAVNGFQTSSTSTSYYVLGQSGEQLAMISGAGAWQRSNVYGDGKLLATYDSNGLHFHLTDPSGTRRVQVSGNTATSGMAELDCESLPFGDQQNCFAPPNAPSTAEDATPLHFTGKERDTESGNDYFEARYFGSSMGRFLSPDASNLSVDWWLPQTWNRYSYSLNNPLSMVDRNGLWPFWIHNEIYGEAFPGMSKNDLQNVEDASFVMDFGQGQQEPSSAYMHGMSDGSGTVFWGCPSQKFHLSRKVASLNG